MAEPGKDGVSSPDLSCAIDVLRAHDPYDKVVWIDPHVNKGKMSPKPKPDFPRDFGDRIRRLRGRLGITQTQFAQLLGVSFASINRWENGQSRPSSLAWRRIASAEEHGLEALTDAAAPEVEFPKQLSSVEELPPRIDFVADPVAVRAVAEAERLAHGYLFNSSFATETSLDRPASASADRRL